MAKITLKPLDDGQRAVEIPVGKTTIGRGPFLGCSDKKVSRNHAVLEVTHKGEVFLTPTHVNPCFYQPTADSPGQILKKDIPHKLESGDSFSLLPRAFRYQLIVTGDGEENADENDLNKQAGKTNGAAAEEEAILNERNQESKNVKGLPCESLNDAKSVTEKSPSKDENVTTNADKSYPKEDNAFSKKSTELTESQNIKDSKDAKEDKCGEKEKNEKSSAFKQETTKEVLEDSGDNKQNTGEAGDSKNAELCTEEKVSSKQKFSEKVLEESESTLGHDAFSKEKAESDLVQSSDKSESKNGQDKSEGKKVENVSASNGGDSIDLEVIEERKVGVSISVDKESISEDSLHEPKENFEDTTLLGNYSFLEALESSGKKQMVSSPRTNTRSELTTQGIKMNLSLESNTESSFADSSVDQTLRRLVNDAVKNLEGDKPEQESFQSFFGMYIGNDHERLVTDSCQSLLLKIEKLCKNQKLFGCHEQKPFVENDKKEQMLQEKQEFAPSIESDDEVQEIPVCQEERVLKNGHLKQILPNNPEILISIARKDDLAIQKQLSTGEDDPEEHLLSDVQELTLAMEKNGKQKLGTNVGLPSIGNDDMTIPKKQELILADANDEEQNLQLKPKQLLKDGTSHSEQRIPGSQELRVAVENDISEQEVQNDKELSVVGNASSYQKLSDSQECFELLLDEKVEETLDECSIRFVDVTSNPDKCARVVHCVGNDGHVNDVEETVHSCMPDELTEAVPGSKTPSIASFSLVQDTKCSPNTTVNVEASGSELSVQVAELVKDKEHVTSTLITTSPSTSGYVTPGSRKRPRSESGESPNFKKLLRTNKRIEGLLLKISQEMKTKNDLQAEVIELKRKKLKLMCLSANVDEDSLK